MYLIALKSLEGPVVGIVGSFALYYIEGCDSSIQTYNVRFALIDCVCVCVWGGGVVTLTDMTEASVFLCECCLHEQR